MSFILITRRPEQKLIIITDYDPEDENNNWPAEFETYEQAEDCAKDQMLCLAFGYKIVEIDI